MSICYMAISMRLPLPLGFFPRTRPSCISTGFRFDLSPPYHLSTCSRPYLRRKSSKVYSSFSGTSLPVPSKRISETSTSTLGVLTTFFHQCEDSCARKYNFPSLKANQSSTSCFSPVFLPLVVRFRYGVSSNTISLVDIFPNLRSLHLLLLLLSFLKTLLPAFPEVGNTCHLVCDRAQFGPLSPSYRRLDVGSELSRPRRMVQFFLAIW